MFCEVADDLAAAKCTFVGEADPASAIVGLTVPPDLREMVRSAPDVVLRETLADLCIDRMFRTDIFRRGLAPLRLEEHRRFVDAVSLVWSGGEYEADREVALAGGSVRLDEAFYRPLVERLAHGALTGAEIREVVREPGAARVRGRRHACAARRQRLRAPGAAGARRGRSSRRRG